MNTFCSYCCSVSISSSSSLGLITNNWLEYVWLTLAGGSCDKWRRRYTLTCNLKKFNILYSSLKTIRLFCQHPINLIKLYSSLLYLCSYLIHDFSKEWTLIKTLSNTVNYVYFPRTSWQRVLNEISLVPRYWNCANQAVQWSFYNCFIYSSFVFSGLYR